MRKQCGIQDLAQRVLKRQSHGCGMGVSVSVGPSFNIARDSFEGIGRRQCVLGDDSRSLNMVCQQSGPLATSRCWGILPDDNTRDVEGRSVVGNRKCSESADPVHLYQYPRTW